jgi:DMSO/TMAO reductase YedYZ molybdopterin-dependent catalytic subunit
MSSILDLVKPLPEAKWVVFYSGYNPDHEFFGYRQSI